MHIHILQNTDSDEDEDDGLTLSATGPEDSHDSTTNDEL